MGLAEIVEEWAIAVDKTKTRLNKTAQFEHQWYDVQIKILRLNQGYQQWFY